MTVRCETSPVTLMTLDSFVPDTMERAVSGGALDHVQLGKGRFRGRLLHADFGDSRLDWGAYNLPLLAVGPMPPDRVTLGFVSAGGAGGTINGYHVERPSAVIMGDNSELHYRLAAETRWAALQVMPEILERIGLAVPSGHMLVPVADPGRQQGVSRTLDAAIAALADIAAGSTGIPDPEALMLSIEESLVSAFAGVMESAPLSRPQRGTPVARSLRLVRRAEEYLRANFAGQMRISDLCGVASASLRTLERAFMDVHGVTPKQFLTLLRLKEARCRMLRGSRQTDSVAEIAARVGFTHLGRFSVQYRRHFGESPLATLRWP